MNARVKLFAVLIRQEHGTFVVVLRESVENPETATGLVEVELRRTP
jgi:hypothetical protein